MDENLATLWEHVAATVPDRVAVRQGGRALTYRDFERRSAQLASALLAAGVGEGTKVACFLYNSPELLETLWGALKVRAVPVNVNYRYQADEVRHLLTDADAEVLVFHSSLAGRLRGVLEQLPDLRLVVRVRDEPGSEPGPAVNEFEDLIGLHEPLPPTPRSGQDQLFTYTGGTTGLPKGVVWTHSALFDATSFSAYDAAGRTPPDTLEEAVTIVRELLEAGTLVVSLPVVPLMHTTGLFVSIGTLLVGGTVVFTEGRSLDPPAIWKVVADAGVAQLVIAGDAVARPLVEELRRADADGRPYDLRTLVRIISAGVAWTDEVKRFLLERGHLQLVEILAASEGGPFAFAVSSAVDDLPSRFRPVAGTRVFRDDGGLVTPGSDEIGTLAFAGAMPLGYYKDPEKTASVYRWIEGTRYVMPGDYVRVRADGSIEMLGRGAAVINTGGEKVYPAEVEGVLLAQLSVADCAVVGVPDARWGEVVTALVVPREPGAVSVEALMDAVGAHLAGYKKPRHVVLVDSLRRGPNSKLDLAWARDLARKRVRTST
ncbi:MAG: AMP-binding protein [Candidatus Dormibacteraeota bacterium]|nr:AMP-binding protein [Candidatus Dormibacteraeota bacterium]MBO0760017.1 AMP-binding protein [Candidatus Dormibacteraeota bacterium]